jgi:hypothetical protein
LKTGENPPRASGLNGFAMVMVAEGMGLTSNVLLWMPLGLQGISDRRDM